MLTPNFGWKWQKSARFRLFQEIDDFPLLCKGFGDFRCFWQKQRVLAGFGRSGKSGLKFLEIRVFFLENWRDFTRRKSAPNVHFPTK